MDSPIELLDQLRPARLLVLGDVMLDRYIWGDVTRISPEAPVPVLKPDLEEVRLGGAASVAMLAQGLGAKVSLCSAIGDDSLGRTVVKLLEEAGIEHSGLITDADRTTTDKLRFLGRAEGRHAQQLFRVDRESCQSIQGFVEEHLAEVLADQVAQHDAVLVSDYAKGVCSPQLLARLIALAREAGVPVLVDPARITNYSRYRGAQCLLPNRSEAQLATGNAIEDENTAKGTAAVLASRYEVASVLLKLDRDGLLLWENERNSHITVPARTRHIYDVTGAGDMVLAMTGLAVGSGFSMPEAAILANVAAGLEVEKLGVAAVSKEELRHELVCRGDRRTVSKIIDRANLSAIVGAERRGGRSIVFTNGCFDLLHAGHVSYLEQAAELGDVLIVGVNGDRSVQELKGPSRPIMGEDQRARLLSSLECVDYVVLFDEPTPHALLEMIRPDILVKGGTYSEQEVVGRDLVLSQGGQVCVVGELPSVSTTGLIRQIVNQASHDAASLLSTDRANPEEQAAEKRLESANAMSCAYRGALTGSVRCSKCKLPVRVHVFECALFKYCTIPKVNDQYRACTGCESLTPPLPKLNTIAPTEAGATTDLPCR